jgi:hypothetical protein
LDVVLYEGEVMPEHKRELTGSKKYSRKGGLKKVGKSRSAARRSEVKISETKIIGKSDKDERRGHWPPW